MSHMNKLLHFLFPRYRHPALERTWSVTFLSADTSVKTAGRTLRTFNDYGKAVAYWNKIIGEPHDKGTFRLVEKAVLNQCEAHQRRHARSETSAGQDVSARVSATEDVRSKDTASLAGEVPE